jgi:glutaredoxin
MKRSKYTWISCLSLLFVMASAHAQLYKWIAPDGSVSYSDTPPPASVTKVERKSYAGGSSMADLPYELAEAAKGNPVTLYTMQNCTVCDAGRKLLNDRGIPFSEKTVTSNDDIERVRQLSGNTQLPILTVGRNKQTGFEPGQWNSALTAAGFPTSNKLPKSYSNPAPEPLVPPKAVASQSNPDAPKNSANTEQKGIVKPPPPLGNAPPGFQF